MLVEETQINTLDVSNSWNNGANIIPTGVISSINSIGQKETQFKKDKDPSFGTFFLLSFKLKLFCEAQPWASIFICPDLLSSILGVDFSGQSGKPEADLRSPGLNFYGQDDFVTHKNHLFALENLKQANTGASIYFGMPFLLQNSSTSTVFQEFHLRHIMHCTPVIGALYL